MKIAIADAASGSPKPLFLQKDGPERRNLQKDDRPFPPRECNSSIGMTGGNKNATRRTSYAEVEDNAASGESGYYYPTGYVPFNTKPLKSCLSSSNLSSMSRRDSDPNLSSRGKVRRNVSFHRVEVREYERAVGDQPCKSGGTSLTLGWNYNPKHTVDFEPYEEERLKRSTSGRPTPVPDRERRRILIEEANATDDELQLAKDVIFLVRGQRKRTVKLQEMKIRKKLEKFEEGFQSAKRKVKRFLSATTNSKEEEKLWKNAEKALQKRTALLKVQSTGDMTQALSDTSSSDNLEIDDLPQESARLSSVMLIMSSSDSEVCSSLSDEEVSSSLSANEVSIGDDWEFSYSNRN